MTNRKELGQHMTTLCSRVFQGIGISIFGKQEENKYIEPFYGQGHIIKHFDIKQAEVYDIDPSSEEVPKRDTLLNPPDMKGKIVLTNPPYIAKNKNTDKTIYEKYGRDDLYKCFLQILINQDVKGGIIVVPLGFVNDGIFKDFINKYSIIRLNYFQEKVFETTTTAVCSFLFTQKQSSSVIHFCFYPEGKEIDFVPSQENNYVMGGEINNFKRDERVRRGASCYVVRCLDVKKEKIGAYYSEKELVPKESDRSFIPIIVDGLNHEEMMLLIAKFNSFLSEKREKYNSMFLSVYRENDRKRITFEMVYKIFSFLL